MELGKKLNLGCGSDYREGYVNVDLNTSHRVDLVSDVTCLEAVADGSCVEVLAQDVLEHIPRARGATALKEWNRVLESGGILRLRVPSLIHLLGLLQDENRQSVQEQKQLIQCLYGTQGYEGDFHFNGYTEVTLRHELLVSGFELTQLKIVDEWMFDAQAHKLHHVAPDAVLRIASDADFIAALYKTLLGRAPDSDGLAYYLTVLKNGITREAVKESIASSEEAVSRAERQLPL